VEALRNKERQDETQFITKIDGFLSFISHWMLTYFFAGFFLMSPCVWPNSGFWCCVFLTLPITLISPDIWIFFYNCGYYMWNRAFEFFDNCHKRLNTQPDTRREFAAVSNMYARPWCTLLCVFHYILIILYFWYIQTRGKKEDEREEGNCVFVWFFVFLFCFGCSSCPRRFVCRTGALGIFLPLSEFCERNKRRHWAW
jgi:hypothetical protein